MKKTIAIVVLVVGIGYVLLLPNFWPEPTIEINVPGEITSEEDAFVRIVVSALHPNFHLSAAYMIIEVDPALNAGTGIMTLDLHRVTKKQIWPYLDTFRLTWPRTQVFTLAIPTDKLPTGEDGLVRGRLRTSLEYCEARRENRIPWEGYRAITKEATTSFETRISS